VQSNNGVKLKPFMICRDEAINKLESLF